MHDDTLKLLNLMFDAETESVCVSPNKFGFHSVPLKNVLSDKTTLVSNNSDVEPIVINSTELIFAALNPSNGYRSDAACTKFRNFLLEIDTGTPEQQLAYIKKLGIPYSAAVFSGNKSIHFLIALKENVLNEDKYRFFAEWMLNVATLCDKNCKNPSRGIRLPGVIRPETGKEQKLLELNDKISIITLVDWFKKHSDAMPKPKTVKKIDESSEPDFSRVKPWAAKKLKDAANLSITNRNKTWYSLAFEFAMAGYSEDYIITTFDKYYSEERDFKRREWLTALKSGIKSAQNKR